jgi:2'-5' RNA ligase
VIRAFLAIELPPDLRARLATIQQDLKRHIEQARDPVRISWISSASMHLTLRFLGDMPEKSIEALRTALEQVASRHEPLAIPIERIGVFPSRDQPRVLWAGPAESWRQGPAWEQLAALQRAVEGCCQADERSSDTRSFHPHLTLARVKEGERHVGRLLGVGDIMDRAMSGGALSVETIALMQSRLHPNGSTYTKLWEVPIGKT